MMPLLSAVLLFVVTPPWCTFLLRSKLASDTAAVKRVEPFAATGCGRHLARGFQQTIKIRYNLRYSMPGIWERFVAVSAISGTLRGTSLDSSCFLVYVVFPHARDHIRFTSNFLSP